MRLTRRGWIGAVAAVAGSGVSEAVAAADANRPLPADLAAADLPTAAFLVRSRGDGLHPYAPALEALRAYAREELAAYGLPGMTLSVTDASGFSAVLAVGWADVERRKPVDPGHYFQIGSISKSFIALTVLALSDQGKIDLDAPISRYLPELPWPGQPITVDQLLSHTGGLADGCPPFPRVPDGRLWCGFAPGSHFSYSNIGYECLGRLIEAVTGEPHQAAVKRLVRDKLDLAGMAGTISTARRAEFAVGYWPADRVSAATLPGARQEMAYWTEEDTPAGSIGATSGQMAAYLRALMRIAAGQGAPVLSDAAARRFAAPVIGADEFGQGARYARGVAVVPIDGAECLHHTGGMMSFSSSFHADPAAGVACFASVNARNEDYRPRQTTAFAVRLMRAARKGSALPDAPDPLARHRMADPAPLVGRFVAADTDFSLVADRGGLMLMRAGGAIGRVIAQGPRRLITDHPAFARYGLDAIADGDKVTGFWWGGVLFGRDAAPPMVRVPERLQALAGDYLNRDPWIGGVTLHARGEALVVEGDGPIVDRGGFWSPQKDPGGVERLRFDGMLGGKTMRLNASGQDLLRITV